MKKIYYIAALSLVVAACANDEAIDSADSNTITYSVTTNNAQSRASEVHNAGDYVNFYVSASSATDGHAYFKNDYVTANVTTGSTGLKSCTWQCDNVRYWPSYALDFFAVHHTSSTTFTSEGFASDEMAVTGSTTRAAYEILGYTTPQYAKDADDLLYAAKKDVTKTTDGKVSLNFRHALARVDFKIQNSSRNVYVEVNNITLCNIINHGEFYFSYNDFDDPADTSDQYTSEVDATTGASEDEYYYSSDCLWITNELVDDEWQDYDSDGTVTARANVSSNSYMNFMPAGTASELFNVNNEDAIATSMLVIPQRYQSASWYGTQMNFDNSYIKLHCRVYNIVNPVEFATAVGNLSDPTAADIHSLLLNGGGASSSHPKPYGSAIYTASNDEFIDLLISLPMIEEYVQDALMPELGSYKNIGWEAGKHYTYNINFTSDPDYLQDASFDTSGTRTLVTLRMSASVNDWYETSSTAIETKL